MSWMLLEFVSGRMKEQADRGTKLNTRGECPGETGEERSSRKSERREESKNECLSAQKATEPK